MKYLLLIYAAESAEPTPGTAEFDAMMEGYKNFSSEVVEAKVMQGGEALDSIATASTVRVRDGKAEITDGMRYIQM